MTTLNPETLAAIAVTPASPSQSDKKFKAVISAECGHYPATAADACGLLKRVIADGRFPWVSVTDKNSCSAALSYQSGNYDSAAYEAIEMLASRI